MYRFHKLERQILLPTWIHLLHRFDVTALVVVVVVVVDAVVVVVERKKYKTLTIPILDW